MPKLKKQSEYSKVISNAPIKGLFSMPSAKVKKAERKKKSIFGSSKP